MTSEDTPPPTERGSADARPRDERLPKSIRVLRRRDFARAQRRSARGSTEHLQALLQRGNGRFGLTVSKKVGKAVTRNLIKRRLRHILREHKALFVDFDVVVVAQPLATVLRALTRMLYRYLSK